MDKAQHVPVLAGRVTALLAPALAAEGAVLVDATLGRAGHARALLEACPGLFLIGIDADVAAIEAAGELLAPYAERVTLVHARYDEIPAILGPAQAMGLLFDLGVSSPQLDDPERGFAYAQDAPLDMRMDRTAERTAADVVNGYPPAELSRILHEYGATGPRRPHPLALPAGTGEVMPAGSGGWEPARGATGFPGAPPRRLRRTSPLVRRGRSPRLGCPRSPAGCSRRSPRSPAAVPRTYAARAGR